MNQTKKLYRTYDNRIILGVCGGLAEYFQVDVVIFRVLFVLLALIHGLGIVAYAVLAVVLVNNPEHKQNNKASSQPLNLYFGVEDKQKTESVIAENELVETDKKNTTKIFGFLILLLGFFLLADEIFPGFIRNMNWQIIFAILAMLSGAYLISRKN